MKLKDLISEYGEYEVYETKGESCDGSYIMLGLEKPKPKTVWELKDGDRYYGVGAKGYTLSDVWREGCYCERDVGNAFLTEKDAKKDIERRKVEALLLKHGGRRWLSHTIPNYYLVVNGFNELYFTSILSSQYPQGIIYFNSGSDVQNAINEIGKERIVKALFEVK